MPVNDFLLYQSRPKNLDWFGPQPQTSGIPCTLKKERDMSKRTPLVLPALGKHFAPSTGKISAIIKQYVRYRHGVYAL